jgi:hypothetical protein
LVSCQLNEGTSTLASDASGFFLGFLLTPRQAGFLLGD